MIERESEGGRGGFLRRTFIWRTGILAFLTLSGLIGLFARMFYLQVSRYKHYQIRARDNRIRIKPLVPERGNIYDRNGQPLTENILRYQLMVSPAQVKNIDALIASLRGQIELDDEELAAFKKRYAQTRRYESALLKGDLDEGLRYRLAATLYRYPGLSIQPSYERYYPYGDLLSHIIGYTSRISSDDLSRLDPHQYKGIEYIGRAGIEKQYENWLRGIPGYVQLEADVNGNMVRVLEEKLAQRGADLYLSLDVALQRFVHDALGDYRGAAVVMDPQNGEVLAMVSKPAYDANLFVRGITPHQYERLLQDPHAPLYHRAVKGRYAPGSVVKPMMALGAWHYGSIGPSERIFCSGNYHIPDSKNRHTFHCWKRSGHGALDMHHAIAESCDLYFYNVGYRLGIEKMAAFAHHFYLGRKTGIDLPDESSGIMPTKAWKERQYHAPWFIGDTINASIGQGYVTTTPLQLAQMTCVLCSQGTVYRPHLLRQLYRPDTDSFYIDTEARRALPVEVYNSSHWRTIKAAMTSVVNSPYGTAHKVGSTLNFRMAGKSGTVQVVALREGSHGHEEPRNSEQDDNAMFIAFAPVDKPKVVVSVVIERGGGGSSVAGPVAAAIAQHYLEGGAHV